MILIISEQDDATTDNVISWLKYYNVKFVRINDTDFFNFLKLCIYNNDNTDFICINNKIKINLKDITGYWYRRGRLSINIDYIGLQKLPHLDTNTNNFINNEYNAIIECIYSELHNLKLRLGNIYENRTNKLNNLIRAKECGLKIPSTWILTKKVDLKYLLETQDKLLTKPITQGGLYYENDSIYFDGLSNIFNESMLENVEESFAPTLFQEYIDKAYELRVFYLEKEIYASAIFSQSDEMTKIDFRNYNITKPNRTPPYNMPNELKEKIIRFMELLGMKTGSLDILVDKKKDYYFLEVNPIGQFFQVSHPCNFYIEKRIAKYFYYGK